MLTIIEKFRRVCSHALPIRFSFRPHASHRLAVGCTVRTVSSSFTFSHAIVRDIDPSIVHFGLSRDHGSCSKVNLDNALAEHLTYIDALKAQDIEVHRLPSDGFPDSVFVEDTLVVAGKTMFLTRPGALSRRGEVDRIARYVKDKFSNSHDIITLEQVIGSGEDATLDGGDVLFTGREFFVGKTLRTNESGIAALRRAFPTFPVTTIDVNSLFAQGRNANISRPLHLKSMCSVCGPDHILMGKVWGEALRECISRTDSAKHYTYSEVPDDEAANCVFLNGTLLRRPSTEFPESDFEFSTDFAGNRINDCNRVDKHIEVGNSELKKVDGALTCCSVLF